MDPLSSQAVSSYAESPPGVMWFGRGLGAITRYKDGRFQTFRVSSPTVAGHLRTLYPDGAGTIWGSTWQAGYFRVDDLVASSPRITKIGTADGLTGTGGSCVIEDDAGRIYFGTGNGVDRLDPSSRRVLHLSTLDGLPSGVIAGCARDVSGHIWFDTERGLARLTVAPKSDSIPPPALITAVEVADRPLLLPDRGATRFDGPTLQSRQNRIQVSFSAVNFGSPLLYQYRFDTADSDWSKPIDQQTVIFPDLRPGKYRFLVRAVDRGKGPTGVPASLTFTILAPFWQRWWFLACAAACIAGATYGLYRYRLRQLVAVERVRMHIATDLHDDIGSALSQIAVLSESVRSRIPETDTTLSAPMERIADVAREATAAMSDIVWAINPERDSLGDLSARVRRFAMDVFTSRGIDCSVLSPESGEELKLSIETRRQLLLIVKEAIHNALRHARCTEVSIELTQDHGAVLFRMSDNGIGFDPHAQAHGHGLASMRSRAGKLHGDLRIDSSSQGTRIEFRARSG
jgi:hypothetical protein